MAGRPARFVDKSVQLQSAPSSLDIASKVKENTASINTLLEEEKAASQLYSDAWTKAAERYDSYYRDELNTNVLKKINEVLPKKLQEPLKSNPSYLPIAVIACTEEPSDFFDDFTATTRTMFASNDWDSFPYKSLLILLNLANQYLPSRPDPKLDRMIFRGLETEEKFTVGQQFSLGYFAPFTVRRILALEKKIAEASDVEDEEEHVQPEGGATKTLLRLNFNAKVQGLGVKLLSPHGEDEKEVLVMPQQTFTVKAINKRPKKGFRVIIVEPVDK